MRLYDLYTCVTIISTCATIRGGNTMGNSQTKAKNKYNAKVYDRISLSIKKGKKDEWREEAEKQGLSLNAFIEQAVNQMMTSDIGIDYSCETSDSETEMANTKEQIIQISSENDILDDVILKIADSCQKLLSAHLQLIDLYPYDENDEESGEIKSPYKETIKGYFLTIISEDIYKLKCCANNDGMRKRVKKLLDNINADIEDIKDHIATYDLEEYLTDFNVYMNLSDE